MKETQIEPNDLFYNIDDIKNLFTTAKNEKYYKKYRVKTAISVWTGECAKKLVYYKSL